MQIMMPTTTISILIVDDDPAFREGLTASLKAAGYAIDTARNAEQALQYIQERPVDVVLLDINMPGIGGVEACRRIRVAAPQIGIVMLTVRDAEDDKVEALRAGADDYVTKPFHFRELVARMHAVLRRTGGESVAQASLLRSGELELEVERRTLRKGRREIHLTPKEFDLLVFLMQHKGIPLTRVKILRTVWGPQYGDEPDYLRSYVKNLRKKIEDDPANPEYILTEPWVGYRFRDPSDPDSTPPYADADDPEGD
jgi:two-component system, OmpR family, KDP operon response regulator KdpE